MIKELLAFLEKTGSLGMGFDYTFINDNEASAYSQVSAQQQSFLCLSLRLHDDCLFSLPFVRLRWLL